MDSRPLRASFRSATVLRFDASLACLFLERPLLERFAAARAAGFTAVEIQGPEANRPADIAAAAGAAGVEIVLCNAPVDDLLSGGRGLSGVPGRQPQFREAIQRAAEFATIIGCPAVNVGPSRIGSVAEREAGMATLAENLCYAGELLAAHKIRALVEPVNVHDFPGVLLRDATDALATIRDSEAANVFLQLDLYHMVRMNADVTAVLETSITRLAHVQFADVPGRGPPGSGRIDFETFFMTLDKLGYAGWVGAEYRPDMVTEQTLSWLERYSRAANRQP
jgi:hydroxypyruvate isomerase